MKIGIDARLWNQTGVGRYIRNLVVNLQIIDKKNTYVLFVRSEDYVIISSQISHPDWLIISVNIHWHSIQEQIFFLRILYQEKLDLMHFPYFSYPFFYKKKFVITIHDLIIHHFATGEASTLPDWMYKIKLFGYRILLSQAAKKAQKIITVSRATKQEIIDHLHADQSNIDVTYEGVDENLQGLKNEKISESFNRNILYFLYVGNAYPHKNLKTLVSAFYQFHKKKPEVSLILVGKEDFFYKRLRQKVRDLGLENAILFYNNVSDQELRHLYHHALALVIPSYMEGFGLPAVEAMANRCFVVASDIPSLKEICEDAAIYFPPHSVSDLAEILFELYTHKRKFAHKKEVGLRRSSMFSWKKMAEKTLHIYESCAGLRSSE